MALPAADLWFAHIPECFRAESCYFDTSSKPEEAAFNLRFQYHIRAGVGHLDSGNLTLLAKIRRVFPAAGGIL